MHFEEIPLLRRRELIKRIIDKVVWNGEQLEVFLVTSTSGGTEITDEVISAPEKPAVTEEKAPSKKTSKAKAAKAPVSEPAPKKRCGRKPKAAAEAAAAARAAENTDGERVE